jgi:hypothetical protein
MTTVDSDPAESEENETLAPLRSSTSARTSDSTSLSASSRRSNKRLSTSSRTNNGSVCRSSLRKSVLLQRVSLTADEFQFVNELLDSASDADLNALNTTLNDGDLFFDPSSRGEQANAISNCEAEQEVSTTASTDLGGGGSSRRKSRVEKRKSCNIHAELWKRASIVVEEHQDSAFPCKRSSLVSSIREDSEWQFNSLDEDDYDYDYDSERKEAGQEVEEKSDKPGASPRGLLTRMASQNLYHGEGFEIGSEELFDIYATPNYDPWDEKTDRSGHAFDFRILGTSHFDQSTQPHVMSPPIMYALQSSLPYSRRGESFWLKYSLVRDGASASTFLQNLRASVNTLMVMETIDGEVFGAFTSSPWTIQSSFYGGGESFLWRMKHSRAEPASSVLEQAKRETDLEIFPNTLQNPFTQICRHDKIAVGGGTPSGPIEIATGATLQPKDFGFGIAFDGDYMLEASSSACMTFNSPSLSEIHSDGSKFELINLEVWALTPCITLEEARRMDYHRLFLKRNATM